MEGSIYCITNKITRQQYVGQTIRSIYYRFGQHVDDALKRKLNTKLSQSIRDYGERAFLVEELEVCDFTELNKKERYWIQQKDTYHNGLNDTLGGEGNKIVDENIEKEIIEIYTKTHNHILICTTYHISKDTLKKILVDNNIIKENEPFIKNNYSNAIAAVDPQTGEIIERFESQSAAGRWLQQKGLSKICDARKISPLLSKAADKNNVYCGYKWLKLGEYQTHPKDKVIDRESLKALIRATPFVQIGQKFGVSDNSIRRWCLKYNLPSTKKEISKYSDEEWAEL